MAEIQSSVVQRRDELLPDEWSRLEKRRKSVRDYNPPKWTSKEVDLVSGQPMEQFMVDHASILFLIRARLDHVGPCRWGLVM